jgi:hypothetical protein
MGVLPLTPAEHEHSAAIDEAACWLVATPRYQRGPAMQELRVRFGLSPLQATQACREANLARARAA